MKQNAPPGVVEFDSDQEGAAILGGDAGAIIQYSGNALKADDPAESKVVGQARLRRRAEAGEGDRARWASSSPACRRSAPNKDNAIAFLKWYTIAGDPGRSSPRRAPFPVTRSGFAVTNPGNRLIPVALKQLDAGAEPRPRTPDWAKVEELLGIELNKALQAGSGGGAALDARSREGDGLPQAGGLLQVTWQPLRRERLQGAGLDRALPYLLLAPAVLLVFAVLVYPLWDGLQASTQFYRYGKPLRDVGLDNYRHLWSDPQFLNSLWVTIRFVTLGRDHRDGPGPRARAVLRARAPWHPTSCARR